MENIQFEKALPLLERSLSINRENLPGNHLELANGEIICILQCVTERFMTTNRLDELIAS